MKTIKYKIKGVAPLLMNCAKYVDPLHPKAKELKSYTSKKNKTDDDHREIAKLSWIGSLYFDDKEQVIVPAKALWMSLWNAAKLKKLGVQFKRGVVIKEMDLPLIFKDSKKKILELYKQTSDYVLSTPKSVSGSKVIRYRPIFKEWALEFTLDYDPGVLNFNEISEMVDNAGKYIGVLEERPMYGKFEVVEEKGK